MVRKSGRAAFTKPATRRQKSGLSMVIRALAPLASTAFAACRIRRFSGKYLGRISAMPITESSSIGNRLGMPSACIKGPPIPVKSTCPSDVSPAISAAPSRSPDGSPAIRNSFNEPLIVGLRPLFAAAGPARSDAKQAKSGPGSSPRPEEKAVFRRQALHLGKVQADH